MWWWPQAKIRAISAWTLGRLLKTHLGAEADIGRRFLAALVSRISEETHSISLEAILSSLTEIVMSFDRFEDTLLIQLAKNLIDECLARYTKLPVHSFESFSSPTMAYLHSQLRWKESWHRWRWI